MGTVKVQKGPYKIGDRVEEIYLVARLDSLHTPLIHSNCCSVNHVEQNNVRQVGNQLVHFKYCEFQQYNYYGRHGVDDDNRS